MILPSASPVSWLLALAAALAYAAPAAAASRLGAAASRNALLVAWVWHGKIFGCPVLDVGVGDVVRDADAQVLPLGCLPLGVNVSVATPLELANDNP